MTRPRAPRPVAASPARLGWSGALDTALRVLLVIAAPVSAAIFIAHSL
jgi:hypothetical protein